MVLVSAPAKVILFGEHAVVYGEPAIAIAINLRTSVAVAPGKRFTVNGRPLNNRFHRYIKNAIDTLWGDEPLEMIVYSSVPSSSGMGSSASITVATVSALLYMKGELSEKNVAEKSFEIEYLTQGRASPIDTSTVTHGNGILILREKKENFLWKIEKKGVSWYIHHIDVPRLKLVVGFSGIKGNTALMVDKVRRFYSWNSFAREVIKEIGQITMKAVKALEESDYEVIGKLMNRNNQLLTILGVSHPMLRKMIMEAAKYSYGVKITGAGGGGSIIALTDEQDEVAKAIESVGGKAYKVEISRRGYTLEG